MLKHLYPKDPKPIALKKAHHLQTFQAGKIRYDAMFTRLSGAADTSIFNTIINIIVAMYAYMLHHDPQWPSSFDPAILSKAPHAIIAGGDDGIIYDVGLPALQKAASTFKLCIKAHEKSTHLPVSMLSRVYTSPRTSLRSGSGTGTG